MNFSVHSPAAVFCFMKMNDVQSIENKDFRLLFSIHDCFVFAIKKEKLSSSVNQIKDVLQKEFSEYRPLRLFVDIKFGENLAFLKNYSEI